MKPPLRSACEFVALHSATIIPTTTLSICRLQAKGPVILFLQDTDSLQAAKDVAEP